MQKNKPPEPSYIEDEVTGQRLILDDNSKVIGSEPLSGPPATDDEPDEFAA